MSEPQGFKEAGYEILGELGRGGMGVVFKAQQLALNRTVALKVIKSGSFASEAELIRFQNEAEAVAQLDHPHIVPIYEVSQCRGQHFFSMKLVKRNQPRQATRAIREPILVRRPSSWRSWRKRCIMRISAASCTAT